MGFHSGFLHLLLIAASASAPVAAMSVVLSPSVPWSAPVGAVVTWTARVPDASPGRLWYRFLAQGAGEDPRLVRDYGPGNTLDWTASEHEGVYLIQVSVRNLDTGDSADGWAAYQFTSRAAGGTPVLSPTANPLVFLYSAPPCAVGGRMRVQFQSPDGFTQNTDSRPCLPGLSMNFYLAGMRTSTSYSVKHTVDTGSQLVDGPRLTLTTPAVSLPLAPYTVFQPPPTPLTNGILLQSSLGQGMTATDLYGNLMWFYQGNVSFLTDPEPGGRFLGIYWDGNVDSSQQVLREFDLAGMTLRETNAVRVSEQLVAMGKRPITAFHHDARGMPDDKILVLAATERILTDVQGPGAVDVIGDIILVLDQYLQVVWAWDAFDHLDPRRLAILGETCAPGAGGCAPFYAAKQANDWLHGNSVQLTPDGNILYSVRHQDWLIKIDYRNGQGSDNILWRLGKDGDFQFVSNDPYPWCSHQHDANFLPNDTSTLMVFDNGNTRRTIDPNANSRGQVLRLDETNRKASFVLNVDLGALSIALGSARWLPNGNYSFDVGLIPGDTGQPSTSLMVEVDPSGKIVYKLQAATAEYRTFRMRDLYTP